MYILELVNAEHYGRAGANPKEYAYGNEIHCHVCTSAKFQKKTQSYLVIYMYNNIIQ